jgi:putative transposase
MYIITVRRITSGELLKYRKGLCIAGGYGTSLPGSSQFALTTPLEVFATKRRDRRAALKFLKRTVKRYGRPRSIVTDRLRSYGAAMKAMGIVERQECGQWLNNRAENSHQPFRRREGAMAKFRDVKTLQKFAAVHASIHNYFNQDRHLNRRDILRQNRSAVLAEWRQLAA